MAVSVIRLITYAQVHRGPRAATTTPAVVAVTVKRRSSAVLVVPRPQQLLHLPRRVLRQVLPRSPPAVVHGVHVRPERSHQHLDHRVAPVHAGDVQRGQAAAAPHVHVGGDPRPLGVAQKFEHALVLAPLGQPVPHRVAGDEIPLAQQMRLRGEQAQQALVVALRGGQHPGVLHRIQSPVRGALLGGDADAEGGLCGQHAAESAV